MPIQKQGENKKIKNREDIEEMKLLNIREREIIRNIENNFNLFNASGEGKISEWEFKTTEKELIKEIIKLKKGEDILAVIGEINKKAPMESFKLLKITTNILKNKNMKEEEKLRLFKLINEFENPMEYLNLSEKIIDINKKLGFETTIEYLKKKGRIYGLKNLYFITKVSSDAQMKRINSLLKKSKRRNIDSVCSLIKILLNSKKLEKFDDEFIIKFASRIREMNAPDDAENIMNAAINSKFINIESMNKKEREELTNFLSDLSLNINLFINILSRSKSFNIKLAKVVNEYYSQIRYKDYVKDIDLNTILRYVLSSKDTNENNVVKKIEDAINKAIKIKNSGGVVNYRAIVFGENERKGIKEEFMYELNEYYKEGLNKRDGQSKEIEERIKYIKDALEDLNPKTLEKIKEKISVAYNVKEMFTPEEIEKIKDFLALATYYSYWIYYGKKANNIIREEKFPDLYFVYKPMFFFSSTTSDYNYNSNTLRIVLSDEDKDWILEKNRKNNFPFMRRLFNTTMHEAMHSIGYWKEGSAFNEFATASLQLFYLPQSKKESPPFSTTRTSKKINDKRYQKIEYVEYFIMQYINAKMGRERMLNSIRNGKLDSLFNSVDISDLARKERIRMKSRPRKDDRLEKFSKDLESRGVDNLDSLKKFLNENSKYENDELIKGMLDIYIKLREFIEDNHILEKGQINELDKSFIKDLKNLSKSIKKRGSHNVLKDTIDKLDEYLGRYVDNIKLIDYVYNESNKRERYEKIYG